MSDPTKTAVQWCDDLMQCCERERADYDNEDMIHEAMCCIALSRAQLAAPVAAQEPADQDEQRFHKAWDEHAPKCGRAFDVGYVAFEAGWKAHKQIAAPVAAQEPETCRWVQEDAYDAADTYQAACGAHWTFTEGGPVHNSVKFCMCCGKPVKEVQAEIEPLDE